MRNFSLLRRYFSRISCKSGVIWKQYGME